MAATMTSSPQSFCSGFPSASPLHGLHELDGNDDDRPTSLKGYNRYGEDDGGEKMGCHDARDDERV